MVYTIPPDTIVATQTGHIAHHNNIADIFTGMGAVFNVLNTTYAGGADPTGVADSTTAIAAAITAAGNVLPAGRVYLPAGTYLSGAQSVPTGVSIVGDGPFATTLKLKSSAGATENLITNKQNYSGVNDAQAVTILNIRLDGNAAGQGATWNCGIVFNNDTPSGSFSYVDGRHVVSNLIIQNFTGDGFVQAGRGGVQVSNVQVTNCNGFGFNLFEDSYYVNCSAGACGIDGFIIQGGSNRLSCCKAYFSGAALVSGRGAGATLLSVTAPANAWDGGNITGGLTYNLANGFGNGFLWRSINGTSLAGNFSGGSYSALGAQDNARAGFYIVGGRQSLAAIEADSNNNNGTTSGNPNASYAGVDLACSECLVSGTSWDRAANTNHQAAALNIGTGNFQNSVQMQFHGTLNDGSNLPPLLTGTVTNKNAIQFRAMGSGSVTSENFNASYTPDPFMSEVKTMTLTNNITVNNPALTGTNTTGVFLIPGMRLILVFTQDGVGGRVVTLGGAFKLNGQAFTTTASATSAISFVYDGTSWQGIS